MYYEEEKNMNYTQTIRNYILERKGEMFDVSYEFNKRFQMIPYKTLMRILNRLEDEELLLTVGKGLYFIIDEAGYSDTKLIKYFTSNNRGMLTGYTLYNELGITDYNEKEITIYTNAIGTKTKNIKNIHLKKVNLPFFSKEDKNVVIALELLEYGFNNIIDCDAFKTINVLQRCLLIYSDFVFEDIITKINYSNTTIVKLEEQLNRLGVPNKCMDIFLSKKK